MVDHKSSAFLAFLAALRAARSSGVSSFLPGGGRLGRPGSEALSSREFSISMAPCDSGDAFHDVEGEGLLRGLLARAPELQAQRALLEAALVRLPPERRLPAGTAPGDLVAFLDVGAYSYDQLTANNGRPRPEVGLLAEDGGYRVMRRRDSLPDLLFNEVL